jgi:hypothetical protein
LTASPDGAERQWIKFKGFQKDFDMVPLGPLRTAHSEAMDHYRTIVDRYDGTVYRNMIVVVLEGTTSYNGYINHTPPFKWIIHPNWYTTATFRAKNNGMLGRSNGCITVDPVENNQLVMRLQDGAFQRDHPRPVHAWGRVISGTGWEKDDSPPRTTPCHHLPRI